MTIPEERLAPVTTHDAVIAVCACGQPFVPVDSDEMHTAHYLCAECREERRAA